MEIGGGGQRWRSEVDGIGKVVDHLVQNIKLHCSPCILNGIMSLQAMSLNVFTQHHTYKVLQFVLFPRVELREASWTKFQAKFTTALNMKVKRCVAMDVNYPRFEVPAVAGPYICPSVRS